VILNGLDADLSLYEMSDIACQYMEFAIISDSKKISPGSPHSLSGLASIFNNFISLNLFFHGDSGLVRSEIRKSFRISPFVIKINVNSKDALSWFSGLCVGLRATPFTSRTRLSDFAACAFGRYTTKRLTKPYSGGIRRIRTPSLSTGNPPSADQVTPEFQHSLRGAGQLG
jgi:hypothetical protein